jgi:hypothetical protein
LASTRSNAKEFITKAGQIKCPATFEGEKILELELVRQLFKIVLLCSKLETVDNTSPATNWTSRFSSARESKYCPTFQQMQDLSNFMKDKLITH